MIKRIAQAQIPTTALIFRERIYLTNNKTLPVLVHHDEQKKKEKSCNPPSLFRQHEPKLKALQ